MFIKEKKAYQRWYTTQSQIEYTILDVKIQGGF
nr:MAG TPA: hypothetical protein [Caudoviricetes sp.]